MPHTYTPQLKKLLQENGCMFLRPGKGDHEIWWSPITKRKLTVDNGIPSRHLANKILKDAGLKKAF